MKRRPGIVCYSARLAEAHRREHPDVVVLVPDAPRGQRVSSLIVPPIPPERKCAALARWLVEVAPTTLPPGTRPVYIRTADWDWVQITWEHITAIANSPHSDTIPHTSVSG